jgi:N-acetylglucosaminyldiphosphoundecaprenol N-acetyl-beta-D-mannosaminyltransferase
MTALDSSDTGFAIDFIARGSGNGSGNARRAEPLAPAGIKWPKKYDVFGVGVSATTYEQATEAILAAARQRVSATVTHMSSHGLCMAATDATFRAVINDFDIAAPDGQPVRWTLKWFHKQPLPDRCYGPELMIRLCRAAATEGVSIYLYGSSADVLERLSVNLKKECPGLIIAGAESPPFRKLEPHEIDAAVARINDSGAGLVFIGLGCPRQDVFATEHKQQIQAVQLCVGAAFDFHAGNKKMAPRWMQKRGLEWFYRLTQEPTRLWKRYLVIHATFAFLLTRRLILGR